MAKDTDLRKNKYISAVGWFDRSGRLHPILPLRGVVILGIFLLFVMLTVFIVNAELGMLSGKGVAASSSWDVENKLINQENHLKIKNSNEDPVFRSLGFSPANFEYGRKRILVIGDSFIWGDGLTNINLIWWRQLQWELERRGYYHVDVVAAGLNGASTQDQLDWIVAKKLFDKVKPDLIIFGYVTNDPQMKDEHGDQIVKQFRSSSLEAIRFFHDFTPYFSYMLSKKIVQKQEAVLTFNNEIGYPYSEWEYKILGGVNFDRYKELLKKLSQTLKSSGIPAFFVTTPNVPNKQSFEARYRPIISAFNASGIQLYDLLPSSIDRYGDGAIGVWIANPANGHPGPRMTHFYASETADILEKSYSSILGVPDSSLSKLQPSINDWLPASVHPVKLGESEWTFEYPGNISSLLTKPMDVPHITLNFERSVAIKTLQLANNESAEMSVWATILDGEENFEIHEPVFVGRGKGKAISLTLPDRLNKKRITSLKISMNSAEASFWRKFLWFFEADERDDRMNEKQQMLTSPQHGSKTVHLSIKFDLPAVRL